MKLSLSDLVPHLRAANEVMILVPGVDGSGKVRFVHSYDPQVILEAIGSGTNALAQQAQSATAPVSSPFTEAMVDAAARAVDCYDGPDDEGHTHCALRLALNTIAPMLEAALAAASTQGCGTCASCAVADFAHCLHPIPASGTCKWGRPNCDAANPDHTPSDCYAQKPRGASSTEPTREQIADELESWAQVRKHDPQRIARADRTDLLYRAAAALRDFRAEAKP